MIDGRLFFSHAAKWPALLAFFSLPFALRPTTVSIGEDEVGEPIAAGDDLHERLGWRSGFFLNGPGVCYDVSTSNPHWIECKCFTEIPPAFAEVFLAHMAGAFPLFAFLCKPEEEQARNRIKNTVGANTVESWVGLDINRYIPGLYWLTLLPAAFAAKHNVPIESASRLALEHRELTGAQHLLRYYEKPDDWSSTDKVSKFCSSTPGMFDIERVRSLLKEKDTLPSYIEAAGAWR